MEFGQTTQITHFWPMIESFASHVLMVRPHQFGYNDETAGDNAFQKNDDSLSATDVQTKALAEFEQLVTALQENGIVVTVFDDLAEPHTPDAIFPNNWITLHSNGALITYPMSSPKRRLERREDIIEHLMEAAGYTRRYSLEQYEDKNLFLEGTGSMIFDRENKIVYACLSDRTDPTILDKFCTLMEHRRCVFTAVDRDGTPIYHTNVMMTLGDDFAVICLDSISSEEERERLKDLMEQSGKEVIEIDQKQMASFAGNMLLLRNNAGAAILVMSEAAQKSLTKTQLNKLEKHATVVSSPIPTIEKYGGGSVRCMLTELVDVKL